MRVKSAPKVLILRTAGTNCDLETAYAFEKAGAQTERAHINEFISGKNKLDRYSILAVPGGFSYGDDIASGKILANEILYKLNGAIQRFIKKGKLAIGICNGFQVLVKSGILPNLSGNFENIEATLSLNDSAKFEDRWVHLKCPGRGKNKCVWSKGMEDEIIYLPVAHGEGKFIPKNGAVMKKIEEEDLVVFKYCGKNGPSSGYPENPNGSEGDIAGICDNTGHVLGLMPHPERHIIHTQHPRWTRSAGRPDGDGLKIFRNGVEFSKIL